jgi:zinc/manganese transport system substrate-binding protein
VVVHHRDWSYLFDWLGMLEAGTLEPRPGLPTSAGHLVELKDALTENPARLIIHTAYQTDRPARRLAEMTDIPVVELPYTVGGAPGTDDLFGLFDVTLNRLLDAVQ